MGLMGMLRKLGDRLGILELSPSAQPSAPVKVQTRTTTLAELVMNIRITEVHDLAASPAELSVSFEDVFKAAGIQAGPTGWTVERLKQYLDNERMRKMDRAEAQHETLAMLAAEKVDAADLIKDAISRDRALDVFEESMSKKRLQWKAAQKQLLSELEQRHKEVEQELADEEKKWADWRRRKRQNEVDMAHAIGYLIDRPVISIGEE